MIVKMKFINITGPKDDIDRVTNQYLSKYEMQLESPISELKTGDNLHPFMEVNPYTEPLAQAEKLVRYLPQKPLNTGLELPREEMLKIIRDANHDYMELKNKKKDLRMQRDTLNDRLKIIEPFSSLDFNLHEILQYKHIKFRFGKVSIEHYHKLERYLYEDLQAIFIEGGRDASYVYGVYFTATRGADKIDTLFRSMHFERIYLPDEFEGTPAESFRNLNAQIEKLTADIDGVEDEIRAALSEKDDQILLAKAQLEMLKEQFDVRKVAAFVKDKSSDFYMLCGWMAEKDVQAFIAEIKNDPKVFVVVEEDKEAHFGDAPTKLENPKVFKPFEMFTRMYGLPAHDEMDPTIFVALTYTLIFGAMFGDVGQGLCLLIGGGLLYLFKKINLAGIISVAGIFSTFFGFMYGSFFGFEDIIKPRWVRPIDAMTNLPFLGKLNTVFIVAVAFGMLMIMIAMILHIINGIKARDLSTLFDANGVAGLVFYGAIVAMIVLFMTGHKTPAGIVLAVMFGVPLLLILFKEPLTNRLEKKARKMKEGVGMFFVQGFFEIFETLLSYFSNTISFVRIGAFAVSHAAMMQVVLMLAGADKGHPNWIVVVLGNLFVCGMEGLIVGIQVLRLEYYEMFSRFYKGSGKEFKPYLKTRKSSKSSRKKAKKQQ